MSVYSTGLGAALRDRRLAAVLWLSLLASALVTTGPMKALFKVLDEGAFREALVKGWDGWAFVSFVVTQDRGIAIALASVGAALLVFALLTIFLTGGVLRALIAGRPRPDFRLVVAESAGLFKANLWGDRAVRADRGDLDGDPRRGPREAHRQGVQGRAPEYVLAGPRVLVGARRGGDRSPERRPALRPRARRPRPRRGGERPRRLPRREAPPARQPALRDPPRGRLDRDRPRRAGRVHVVGPALARTRTAPRSRSSSSASSGSSSSRWCASASGPRSSRGRTSAARRRRSTGPSRPQRRGIRATIRSSSAERHKPGGIGVRTDPTLYASGSPASQLLTRGRSERFSPVRGT